MAILTESLGSTQASIILEESTDGNKEKSLYMSGIFIQGEKVNQNGRVYPKSEIEKAVSSLNKRIGDGFSVLGEVDHPDELELNIDRVSHCIEKMWMEGNDGYGKLRIIPTPMGNIIRTLLENGVKLGVSSRGSGEVINGRVKGFEIVTVDIVANPSAPDAYPRAVYESLMNTRGGNRIMETARQSMSYDELSKRMLANDIKRLIGALNR